MEAPGHLRQISLMVSWCAVLRRPAALRLIVLFAALLSTVSCGRPSEKPDLAELDRRVLRAVDQLWAPVPRFSGSSIRQQHFEPVSRGMCPRALPKLPPGLRDYDRNRLGRLSREVAQLSPSGPYRAEVLRLQALWTLVEEPTPEGRERMVRLFQAALELEPRSAERRNDLAASYLLQATLDEQTGKLAVAIELLDLTVRGRQFEENVLFNRAYALQCLTLWHDAGETWRRLPGVPPELLRWSPAESESSDLLPQVGQFSPSSLRAGKRSVLSLSENDPLSLRRRGEWLLGEWATRSLAGDPVGAGALLAQAEQIGERLRLRSGDQLLSGSVRVIREAQRGEGSRERQLERGHAAFHSVRGNAIYSECRPEILRAAEMDLAAAGSPFVGWVRLDEAVCAYFEKDFRRAGEILLSLKTQARRHSDLALLARADWMLGLIRMVQARFVEADHHYTTAISLFSRLGEEAHVVYLHSLRAKNYEYGGARREAWRERLAALHERRVIGDPERLFTIFEEAAQALRSQGHRVAALGFVAEQMRAAQRAADETGATDLLTYTLIARAGLLGEVGRRAEAASDLARATQIWAHLPQDDESRRDLRVDIDVQRLLLDDREDARSSLAAVDRAIDFYAGVSSSLGDQIEILKLLRLRANVQIRLGHPEGARDDLKRGIDEIERQRLELADMEDRARFLSEARGLFFDLIRLELDHFGDPAAALDVLERSSNRVFSDASRAGRGRASRPSKATHNALPTLPMGTLVLRYGHLPDRLLIWTLSGGRLELEQHPIAEADLFRKIHRCRDLWARGASPMEREAACNVVTQTVLPQRLRSWMDGKIVIVIPDEIVAPLPLGALRTSPGGPYLAERFLISYTPTLAAYAVEADKARALPHSPPRAALFVSDPAFNTEIFPRLVRLPGARRFASSYATHYRQFEILSGRNAVTSSLSKALPRFEVFQFDGHAILNTQFPDHGGLLLAPESTEAPEAESSLFTADDLPLSSLGKLRLVILGGCSTGLTTYRETAEVTGLAAAFLSRGVPEIVAAAWDVPDTATALLLDHFHAEITAGKPTDEALRAAQLAMLRSAALGEAEKTRTWAAFQLFRGGSVRE